MLSKDFLNSVSKQVRLGLDFLGAVALHLVKEDNPNISFGGQPKAKR